MATTQSILDDLREQLNNAIAAGKSSLERDVRQQIIAHETLIRLRAEFAVTPSDGLASQIRSWERKVWRDATPEPTAKAKRQRPQALTEPTATEPDGEAA